MPARDDLLEVLSSGRVLLADGAMGTELQRAGLEPGACAEAWNVDHPARIEAIHARYRDAGCELLTTNSFGGTRSRLALHGEQERAAELNRAAAAIARRVAGRDRWVLGDLGPFGGILAPLGDADSETVLGEFREQAAALLDGGADAVIVETQTAIEEMELAVRGARAAGAATVIASFAFDHLRDGSQRTMMGVTPRQACAAMVAAGVDAVGCNCGSNLGLDDCIAIVEHYREVTAKPILVQPNAGQPALVAEKVAYPGTPAGMAAWAAPLLASGARILGGCCGSTPEHLACLRRAVDRRGAGR